jgi:hypothetical protein
LLPANTAQKRLYPVSFAWATLLCKRESTTVFAAAGALLAQRMNPRQWQVDSTSTSSILGGTGELFKPSGAAAFADPEKFPNLNRRGAMIEARNAWHGFQ